MSSHGEKICIEKEKDYHEKDGNIDGKIECYVNVYVNVFLKKPTEKVSELSLMIPKWTEVRFRPVWWSDLKISGMHGGW